MDIAILSRTAIASSKALLYAANEMALHQMLSHNSKAEDKNIAALLSYITSTYNCWMIIFVDKGFSNMKHLTSYTKYIHISTKSNNIQS